MGFEQGPGRMMGVSLAIVTLMAWVGIKTSWSVLTLLFRLPSMSDNTVQSTTNRRYDAYAALSDQLMRSNCHPVLIKQGNVR